MHRLIMILTLCAALAMPAPARALTASQAAARLATIDSELTACWRARALAAVIVVRFLRQCLSDRRPDERALRGELNKWIGTLAGDDPRRAEALSLRDALNLLRLFGNTLDKRLKDLGPETGAADAQGALLEACDAVELDGERGGHRPGAPALCARR